MPRSVILTILIFISTFTSGQVVVKNTGWSKIYVAICYKNNRTGYTSRGWFTVEPSEQKALYNYTIFDDPNFYYCATIDNCDKAFSGSVPLYVNTKNSFTIPNADRETNYENALVQKYAFVKINLAGRSNYLIELNPVNLVCYGFRQGKWKLPLDKEGDYAEKKEDAVYYREISFDQGKPLGWCKDFYKDGKVKAEFKLLSYNPVQYDGKCTWYKVDGSVEKEETYKNGIAVSRTELNESGQAIERKAHYEVVQLPVQNFYLNSTSNETWKGGSSKTIYPVTLPEGTVEWYYEFTASRDKAEVQINTQKFKLFSQLTSLIDKTQILSTSVNMLAAPPGGDVCNVYLTDQKYYNSFLEGGETKHYPSASRLNYNSGIVQVRGLHLTNPMIAIKNPDGYNGINVSIQVVAIVSKIK